MLYLILFILKKSLNVLKRAFNAKNSKKIGTTNYHMPKQNKFLNLEKCMASSERHR